MSAVIDPELKGHPGNIFIIHLVGYKQAFITRVSCKVEVKQLKFGLIISKVMHIHSRRTDFKDWLLSIVLHYKSH